MAINMKQMLRIDSDKKIDEINEYFGKIRYTTMLMAAAQGHHRVIHLLVNS
jgi:hypothetical protein